MPDITDITDTTKIDGDKNTLDVSNKNVLSQKGQHDQKEQGNILSPFKVHNFRLLFAGQTISTLGDAFYAVALPWLVLTTGGNAQELGVILTAYGIPRVATLLLGGILSDRLRPRRVMLLADIVRAVLVGMLAVLALWKHPLLWQLLAVSIPLGAFEGLFLPASSSILPDVLADDGLQAGNSLNFSSVQLAMLIGSSIAGVVVGALSSGVALVIDAFTFVASAASLMGMQTAKRITSTQTIGTENIPEIENTEKINRTGQVNESEKAITLWQLVRTSQFVRVAFIVSAVANLAFGGLMEVALPELVRGSMAAGASGFGFILASFGAGALSGSLIIGSLGRLQHRALIALLSSLVQALAIAFVPFSGGLIGAMACMFIVGISNSVTNVLFFTLIQQSLPRHLLGRIMSIFMLAAFGSYPLSVLITGIIVVHTGPAIFFPVCGIVLALAIVFGLLQRELREL